MEDIKQKKENIYSDGVDRSTHIVINDGEKLNYAEDIKTQLREEFYEDCCKNGLFANDGTTDYNMEQRIADWWLKKIEEQRFSTPRQCREEIINALRKVVEDDDDGRDTLEEIINEADFTSP